MTTQQKVFTVANGTVVFTGNVFIKSAQANSGWIIGDYIDATTKIQLHGGSIVLDGEEGRVSVFDPANTQNGNFIQIESGFVRQYENFHLTRSLKMIEEGSCYTDKWTTLHGYYKEEPDIMVSPKLINSFNKNYAAQDQSLSCYVADIQKVSEGKWRFKARAQLLAGSGDFYVTPPATVTGVGAGNWGRSSSTDTVTTTTATVTCTGCNKITVEAGFMPVYTSGSPSYWYGGKLRWRIKYRLKNTSTWSYSSWTSYVSQTVWNDWSEKTNSLSISVSQGTYEVCFEIYSELGSALKRDNGFTERPPEESDYWRARSITLNSSAASTAASGLLAFTAVGE